MLEYIEKLKEITLFHNWSSNQCKRFFLNITLGLSIAIVLQFSSYLQVGSQLLNTSYDFLIKKDFIRAVIEGKENNPISDDIRLVIFDKESYVQSSNLGFWTPRDLLGKAIIKTLELGAKVVLVDFALDRNVPEYYSKGIRINENEIYLSLLQKAANLAEKNEAVIIFPWNKKIMKHGYTQQYYDLLETKKSVFKIGSSAVFSNALDRNIRHFNFFEKVTEGKMDSIIFFMPVMAVTYKWYENIALSDKKLYDTKIKLLQPGFSSSLKIQSIDKKKHIKILNQNPLKECVLARYKFRIVSRSIMKKFGHGKDLLFDISLTPAELLEKKTKSKIFSEKIVLIGSTYEAMQDLYVTPVGEMPGIFLLANAVNLFLKGEQIYEPFFLNYLVLFIWITILALIFVFLSSGWASFIVTIMVLVLYTPISTYCFYKWGVFFDFWLPVTIMGLCNTLIGWFEFLKRWLNKSKERL